MSRTNASNNEYGCKIKMTIIINHHIRIVWHSDFHIADASIVVNECVLHPYHTGNFKMFLPCNDSMAWNIGINLPWDKTTVNRNIFSITAVKKSNFFLAVNANMASIEHYTINALHTLYYWQIKLRAFALIISISHIRMKKKTSCFYFSVRTFHFTFWHKTDKICLVICIFIDGFT